MKKLKNILRSNLILVILLIVICFSYIKNNLDKNSIFNEKINEIVGIVVNIKEGESGLTFTIKSKEKVLCNYYSDEDLGIELGDKIRVIGSLNKPTNNTVPNNFNYKNYLESLNIFYIMNVEKIEFIEKNNNIFYKIKNILVKKIDEFQIKDYLNTFILGNKDYLSDDVYDSYRINGVVHLFCISGTHITLLVGILLFIFDKIKLNIKLSYFIVFILLIFYMFLTSFSASILRSGVFFILLGLKKLNYLKFDTIDIFYLTIIILLLINSNLLNNIGFLYSASITLGLLLSKRLIKGNYIKKVFVISLISTIISLPITINNFYEINLLGIIYNIFFVPIISFIVTPLSFLVLIFPFLENIMIFLIKIIELVSFKLNIIQFNLVIPKLNVFFIIIYYLLVYLFLKQKNRYLIYIILLILFQKSLPILDNNYYLYFLDVGQGDSTLIKYKDEIILIDTGGIVSFNNSDYKVSDNTITLIKSLGFNSIDYLILTHGDYDHMGDAINLVSNFKVEKVIFNNDEYNDLELELIKVLKDNNIPYHQNIKELNIDNNKLYFLNNELYDNENDNSNVIYTELNNHKFLFMGDAGVDVEEAMLEKYNFKDIDILKVGHHGSKTSTSNNFAYHVAPKYSIISVGKNNRYGHPNKEVLENLDESKIYRTDQDGSIMFKFKNNKLEIETCTP